MQEVSTTNEQKQCSNPETSNAIVRGNTLHIVCQFLLLYGYLHLIVQTVGRASRAECSSGDLNLDEIKNALRLLSVNGETNLMNLIVL